MFKIHPCQNDYAIIWSSQVIDKIISKHIFELLFNKVKSTNVGVFVNRGEHDNTVLWISDNVYYTDTTGKYQEWIMSQHEVLGFVFHTMREIDKFKEEVEKMVTWEILKT